MQARTDTKNCLEANYKISNGKEIYNCTKCMNHYKLEYNKKLNINYCIYDQKYNNKCLVKLCKTCETNNNYFCSNCLDSDYEVNIITGSCVKKMNYIPSITWKDLYKYNMKGEKEINGRIIKGPSFTLRGITCSQISSKHAFLIYQIYSLNNTSEIIKVPTICEIEEEIEETNDDINIVDYNCIGNITINDNYKLINITGDNLKSNIPFNQHNKISSYTFK